MKKIGLNILTALLIFSFSSCQEDLEIWDSETLEYSGRFIVDLLSEDMNDVYVRGEEIMIYNTSDNIENEVWIDDHGNIFPLKSKFIFSGNSSSFKSNVDDFAQLTYNNIMSTEDVPSPAPTAAGQTTTVDEQWYVKAAILEGKILPKAATTVGGNEVDSLYMKVKLYSGVATFKSYEIPESMRQDPEKAEFKWKFESATHDATLDETYVLSGHRYSGMPEDR